MSEAKWFLRTQDETFGPVVEEQLVSWAKMGRVQPGQEISDDNVVWRRVEDVPFLDMRFSIDIGDGTPRGPFNRAAAEALLASGRLPPTATMVETREPFPEESAEPATQEPDGAVSSASPEPVQEKVVEKEVRVEVPVEKIVEVPVEKIVEKIVEKVVVDETRVHELEGLLAEERRHTAELQSRLDAAAENASAAKKAAAAAEERHAAEAKAAAERAEQLEAALRDATDRENKYTEQVAHLEDELRRLPQAASEVADIQAAVYSIMKSEAEDIDKAIEEERREFEEFKKRFQTRGERLAERRREILKRSGPNIEDMTRRALLERPEDPRTAQLRKELGEARRTHERQMLDAETRIRELSAKLRERQAEEVRAAEGLRDVTQLRQEVQSLRERLQLREKELVAERQLSEELRQQQAARQQVLMARLATLESPSIGTSQTLSTNMSRETKQVKLPSWMRLGK